MSPSNLCSCLLQSQKFQFCLISQFMIFFFLLLLPHAKSVSFNYPSFNPNVDFNTIMVENATYISSEKVLQLTKNQLDGSINSSVGRASYYEPVRLWDKSTGRLTDFATHFSFIMKPVDPNNTHNGGDGLSFFIAPFDSVIPNNSAGGYLALFNESTFNASTNQIVAVEFDTNKNNWDPSDNHVGIDVNSPVSVANVTWSRSIKDGSTANAWVSYNSTTHNLIVFLTFADPPVFIGNSSLSHIVDLRTVLPEHVRVGFSAATGGRVELHTIYSWSFNSSLETDVGNKKNKMGLVIGLAVGFGVLSCGLGLLWFLCWRKSVSGIKEDLTDDNSMDDEFEKGTRPKRFAYRELSRATNNFAKEGKLGEGGFGGIYKGWLSESNTEVAVKRVSKDSKQGKKEYVPEVKIISHLRHRNLVQLIGWCHQQGEFLLVDEYMPNGSLDSHLYGSKIMLTWPIRYKIATSLASALLYLHEEWEQCMVHRDVKSSNVMLDSNFNAKLSDFGLARLVDHALGSQTTVLAGTMGYLAPKCFTTGKANKESDVYSFGVVSLEIACGRRPMETKAEPSKIRMVEWVWDLYGKGLVLEAVDEGLSMEFDEQQMECLMVVGLWCCHPDPTIRPSIKQVINILNFEAPLPNLPSKFPVPMYVAPPMHECRFSHISSSSLIGSTKDKIQYSYSNCSTYSSMSVNSGKTYLNLHKDTV